MNHQATLQPAATNQMVLYHSPSNQNTKYALEMKNNQSVNTALPRPASMAQPATAQPSVAQPSTSPQAPLAAQPITPMLPQVTQNTGQDLTNEIAKVMRDQFGLKPKQQSLMYKTLYPAAYDQIPFPHKYKIPDFTKFSGQGDVSTVEHVNRFIIQCE